MSAPGHLRREETLALRAPARANAPDAASQQSRAMQSTNPRSSSGLARVPRRPSDGRCSVRAKPPLGSEPPLDLLDSGRLAERVGSMTAMRHRPRIRSAVVTDSNRCAVNIGGADSRRHCGRAGYSTACSRRFVHGWARPARFWLYFISQTRMLLPFFFAKPISASVCKVQSCSNPLQSKSSMPR